ncbi:MAG: hypothetical protein HXY24_10350, partial [Rubrivivax sp.]|nr:hypothetical protein [Rubrivivax sp.]
MRRVLHILAALLSASAALAQAPGIVWERYYPIDGFGTPWSIRTRGSDEFVVGFSASYNIPVLRWFDLDGDTLGSGDTPWYRSGILSLEVLDDGGVIATGWGYPVESSPDEMLMLARFAQDGTCLWARSYDVPGAEDRGLDVDPLPDGGFAVCGYTETDGDKDAWVMRTDSQGDTLWSVQWGWSPYDDIGLSIFYNQNGLIALFFGREPGYPYSNYLVRYTLDGEYEWLHNVPTGWLPGCGMCEAVPDGYAYVYSHTVVRISPIGDVLWTRTLPVDGEFMQMYSIKPAIWDGFIIAGWDDESIEPWEEDRNAYLGRVSSTGETMWSVSMEKTEPCEFRDVIQMPQGGYMAVGRYLVLPSLFYLARFEPETGIGEQEQPAPFLAIGSCVPNPGGGSVSIHWTSAGPGDTELTVFDISGRVVGRSGMGILAAGE